MEARPKRDYYEVLGLDRSANQEQIKQAYRQLAMTWHPDRNKAPNAADRFKEIAEAYAVLSDPHKRQAYDTTGHAGISERWSTEDLFRDFEFGDFFGGRMGDIWSVFGDLFPGRMERASVRPHGTDLRYELNLSLDEAAKGGERIINVSRSDRCKTCGGSGAKPGTKPVSCAECHGTGEKQQVRTDKMMRVVTLTTCQHCHGRGIFIESPCAACNGTGFQFLPHSIKVTIPAGVEHGMLLRLAGQGEAGPQGGIPGDLLVRIYVQPHATLKRDGDDLYTVMPISFADAALGTKVTVDCLHDERVLLTVPPGTQSGTMLRARGKGMPRLHGRGKGDLYVVVEVKTPTDLTPRQRELLREFKMEASKKATATGFYSASGLAVAGLALLVTLAGIGAPVEAGGVNMNSVRYFLATFLVISLPALFLYWLLIHPFVDFWRGKGIGATYTVVLTIISAAMIGLFSIRHELLSRDFGTNYFLLTLGVLSLILSGRMRFAIQKHLGIKTLLGFPEIAPDRFPRQLITDGIYARMRHPRYVQFLIALIGYALIANYLAVYLVVALWLPGIYVIVRLEEQELRNHFGSAYEEYCRKVPRFLPSFRRAARAQRNTDGALHRQRI